MRRVTHPPLKAPTGFRTGIAVAVASCRRADDRNVREVRRGDGVEVWRKARMEGVRILEAMVNGWSLAMLFVVEMVWGCEKKVGLKWMSSGD